MPSRWRRGLQLLATLSLLTAMLACGGSGGSSSGEADPPGEARTGSGPVASGDEAASRVVTEYFGLTNTRQGGPVIGAGDDPAGGLFAVQREPLPRGTTIQPFIQGLVYVLNRPYYVFFYDPNLAAEFEHLAFFLYVRPTDGAIFEQKVKSWPTVDGVSRLVAEADKLANVVYVHEHFESLLHLPAARQTPTPPLTGAGAHGLIVAHEEARRQGDIDNAAEYMQALTGEANPLSVLWHKHPDPIGKDDLAEKLRDASEGLGAGDKFFLFFATHGSEPPNSRILIGDDRVPYDELCRLINDNVTAGHINIINGACFGGNMTPIFQQWDESTSKEVRWFTATDATHPAYAFPDNLGLKCAVMQLLESLQADGENGTVTLAEVEQAMQDLELTDEEILEKMCEAAGIEPNDPNPPAWKMDIQTDDPGDDEFPRPGVPGTGGFSGDTPPAEISQSILDLFEKLRQARLADDPILLGPLYDPNYNYDGKNHSDIIRIDPSFDTTVFGLGPVTVNGQAGDDVFNVDIDRTIEVHGTQPIRSEQSGTRVFRVDPTDPVDIVSERLAFWRQFDFGGALGLQAQPPGAPVIQPPVVVGGTPFQVDSFFDVFIELSVNGLQGNDVLHVETDVSFLRSNRQFTGTQVDGVFASLAGNTVQLQQQGSTTIYAGGVPIPRQVGFWVLSISASSRIANGQTGDFVSAATGRSIEIRIVP